jgi:hypothetical protein
MLPNRPLTAWYLGRGTLTPNQLTEDGSPQPFGHLITDLHTETTHGTCKLCCTSITFITFLLFWTEILKPKAFAPFIT